MPELAQFSVTVAAPLTAADWADKNPMLEPWQMGIESDTHLVKFNTNFVPTAWNDIADYFNPAGNTGATKATGEDLDAGTDDEHFATAKALADSGYLNPTPAANIADPTGAVTDQDDEARAAIEDILDLLEVAGLMEQAA